MICIDYADPEDVKQFFTEMSTNFEVFQKPLSTEAIDTIAGCIGGNLEDLDRVVTGLTRGDAYFNVDISIHFISLYSI